VPIDLTRRWTWLGIDRRKGRGRKPRAAREKSFGPHRTAPDPFRGELRGPSFFGGGGGFLFRCLVSLALFARPPFVFFVVGFGLTIAITTATAAQVEPPRLGVPELAVTTQKNMQREAHQRRSAPQGLPQQSTEQNLVGRSRHQ